MRPRLLSLALLASAFAWSPHSSVAAVISYAGATVGTGGANNDAVDQFRSTSVAKPLNPMGKSIYGSDGYVLYGTDATPNSNAGAVATVNPLLDSNTLQSVPSYLTLSSNGQNRIARSYGYQTLDNPTLPIGPMVADIESGGAFRDVSKGTEVSLLNFTVGAGFPTGGLRVGVMLNNSDAYDGVVRLSQTIGGSASSSVSFPNSAAALYFFDVTQVNPGDVFTLYLTKNLTAGGNANVIYGGLTFDIIPEPSRGILLTLFAAGFVIRRRRK